MAGEVNAAWDAFLAVIQAINGAGSYAVDLSNAVQGWPPIEPLSVPSTYLWPVSWEHDLARESDLGSFGLWIRFGLTTFQAPAADSGLSRLDKLVASDNDLMAAIQANMGLSNTVFQVRRVVGELFSSGQQTAATWAGIQWEIDVDAQRARGG